MARLLALDVGERYIGVAVSDALNIVAQGLETIKRKTLQDTLRKIEALVKEYGVRHIVVGLPLNMDGSKGKSVELIEAFTSLLKKEINIKIEMMDERLTTQQGSRVLLEADISRKKRKRSIDKISAQLILQAYLDSHAEKDSLR